MGTEYDLIVYQTNEGKEPFTKWIQSLDGSIRAYVRARIKRVSFGNLGDCKWIGRGVMELRLDRGPGYRVYFAMLEQRLILLLAGGDKSTQDRDITKSQEYLADWKERV
jgi:putative addiction module killer protein